MPRQPLYPHQPKRKSPLYPHQPKGTAMPQTITDAEPVPARYNHLVDWFDIPMPQTIVGAEPVPRRLQHLITWVDEPLPDIAFMPALEADPGERKVEALLKKLEAGVETIHQSDNFRLFLTTMSKFRDYSFGNQILIMLQKPGATHVAGFVAWKELGRWVKKGEAGIAILAPVFSPRQECTQCGAKIPKGARFCPGCGTETDEDPDIASPRYFRTVYVFDISQTDGEPLPQFDVPTLTGDMNTDLWHKTLALMQAQGVRVSFEPQPHQPPGIKGYYRQPAEIWVRPEEPPAQQLKTLLHEAAHHYSASIFRIPRADAETIAESAAFVIGAHYGFDSGVRSFPYVALWSRDKKVLKANLKSIQDVSTRILEGLEG